MQCKLFQEWCSVSCFVELKVHFYRGLKSTGQSRSTNERFPFRIQWKGRNFAWVLMYNTICSSRLNFKQNSSPSNVTCYYTIMKIALDYLKICFDFFLKALHFQISTGLLRYQYQCTPWTMVDCITWIVSQWDIVITSNLSWTVNSSV